MSISQFILWTCITLIPRADKDSAVRESWGPISPKNIGIDIGHPLLVWITIIHSLFLTPRPFVKNANYAFLLESVQGEQFGSISFRSESRLSVLHCLVTGPCKGGWPMPTISLSTWTYQSPLLHSTFSVSISLTLLGTAKPLEVSRSKHRFNLQVKWNH